MLGQGLILPGGGAVPITLWDAITAAGLTTNVRVCVDAGDSASYGGTGQTYTDRSGTQNFFLGATSSAEGSDPTFNGTAGGLSANEYFSFDGGDYFRIEGGNPAWVQTLHQEAASFSAIAIIQQTAGQNARMWGTDRGDGNSHGASFDVSSDVVILGVDAGFNPSPFIVSSDAEIVFGRPTFLAVSIDENGGNVSFLYENGLHKQVSGADTFDASYSSPSASNADGTFELGSRGSANFPATSGVRHFAHAIWTGQALTKAQIDDIYFQVRERWGLG